MSAGNGASALPDGEGWYLYGIVPAGVPPAELEGLTAVDPRHDVAVLAEGELAGVTSRVSLAEFDEAALPERLGDAAWLEQKIRAHESVLETSCQPPAPPVRRYSIAATANPSCRSALASGRTCIRSHCCRQNPPWITSNSGCGSGPASGWAGSHTSTS